MKAVRFYEYGAPDVLRYEEVPDPVARDGEVLVRVAATSVNPIDLKTRSGATKDRMPIDLPFIPGVDLTGTVVAIGAGVESFRPGDKVMGVAKNTYAELCAVAADRLALIPKGLEFEDAAVLPLVNLTGDQLVGDGAKARPGQTILVTGALGAVGRSAVFAATQIGCRVIAGVRAKETKEARAMSGVNDVVAVDDDADIAALQSVDCVADTIGGDVATKIIGRIVKGGVFGTTVQGKYDASDVEVNAIFAHPEPATTLRYAQAARDGDIIIPRGLTLPLSSAREAHRTAEAGSPGKIVLIS